MRAIWFALPLALAAITPITAQSRGDSRARQAQLRADSIKRARQDVADSIRRRNPSEARRQRENAQRIREQKADSIRRRIQPNRLEPVPTRPAQLAGTRRLDSIAAPSQELSPTSFPTSPSVPATPRPVGRLDARAATPPATSLSAVTDMPASGRVRAAVLRMRDRADSPSFCRTGAGHPVYGRDWCWERGFRLGNGWDRDRGGSVRLAPPVGRPIDQAVLTALLDSQTMSRIQTVKSGLRLTAPLNASWLETTVGGRVLTIRAGSTPIAEISDRNRDGRADALWFRAVR